MLEEFMAYPLSYKPTNDVLAEFMKNAWK